MGADVVGALSRREQLGALPRREQFGGEARGTDLRDIAPGEGAEEGLAGRRYQDRQPEPGFQMPDPGQGHQRGFGVAAQEVAKPGVDDEPLRGNAGRAKRQSRPAPE